jgi:hypothetical protein
VLFTLNIKNYQIERLAAQRLSSFGWKEADLQRLLFQNLEKVLQDEDLLLIMQSVTGKEQPDLMAVDKSGDLYIFELKAWESEEENLLQALRYGQIYGQYDYDRLNRSYIEYFPEGSDLLTTVNSRFEVTLRLRDFNQKQHFVIITNGLDFRTRAAILYWRSQQLDVNPWIYRLYRISDQILFEFETFQINDNPYSDIEEGYFILNTNYSNDPKDDREILDKEKASAFFDPWKRRIERLKKGNTIFLYRSGEGIVAYGNASGKLEKHPYQGNPQHADEEYSMKLSQFKKLKKPMEAKEIKAVTGVNYRFMSTMFGIDSESGTLLRNAIEENYL